MITEPRSAPRSPARPGAGALRGRDIVCFSHDWTGDPLSKTHLMRLLARDNRVLWVNSIGYRAPTASRQDLSRAWKKLAAATRPISNPEKNIFVLSPLAIPAYQRASIRKLNGFLLRQQVRWAFRRLGFRQVINWIFNPPAAVVAGTLGEDRLIYHCVDEYAAFTGVSRSTMEDFERYLLEKADLSIVTSEGLLETRRRIAPAAILVRHGVDVPHFRRAIDPATVVPPDLASLPGPVIGFFGLIADWVDVELMAAVAFFQRIAGAGGKGGDRHQRTRGAAERASPRPQAILGAARLLQGIRRRAQSFPGERADAQRQSPQDPGIPRGRASGCGH